MGWRELGEIIRKAREASGLTITDLSYITNISKISIEKMESGDFSFDKSFYVEIYLSRLAETLKLNADALIDHYREDAPIQEEVEKVKERSRDGLFLYIIAGILSVFVILMAFKIESFLSVPYAFIENTSGNVIYVNGDPVPPGSIVSLKKSAVVRGNEGEVLIREISGRMIKVRIRDFEVRIYGTGQVP